MEIEGQKKETIKLDEDKIQRINITSVWLQGYACSDEPRYVKDGVICPIFSWILLDKNSNIYTNKTKKHNKCRRGSGLAWQTY